MKAQALAGRFFPAREMVDDMHFIYDGSSHLRNANRPLTRERDATVFGVDRKALRLNRLQPGGRRLVDGAPGGLGHLGGQSMARLSVTLPCLLGCS